MKKRSLSHAQMQLLSEVIRLRDNATSTTFDRLCAGIASEEDREMLADLVADEFLKELDEDDEPSERGILLDELAGLLYDNTNW